MYVIEDTGCSIEEAMERVYNSKIMTALQDEEYELYVQSPAYHYELMNRKQFQRCGFKSTTSKFIMIKKNV